MIAAHSVAAFAPFLALALLASAAAEPCARDCPVCGASSSVTLLSPAATDFTAGHATCKCAACQVAFVDPMPSGAQLERLYAGAYYKREKPAAQGLPPNASATAIDRFLLLSRFALRDYAGAADWIRNRAQLALLPPRSASHLLEIGCGQGAMSRALMRLVRFNRVTCIEPDPSKVIAAERVLLATAAEGMPAAKKNAALPLTAVDVHAGMFTTCDALGLQPSLIVLAHVLEHVMDPHAFIESLADCLKPGGFLYIGVPYMPADRCRQVGSCGSTRKKSNFHLFFYGPKAMEALIRRHPRFELVGGPGGGHVSYGMSPGFSSPRIDLFGMIRGPRELRAILVRK
jgi:SAM-dependent methyltransferase